MLTTSKLTTEQTKPHGTYANTGGDSSQLMERHLRAMILSGSEISSADLAMYKSRFGDAADNEKAEQKRHADYRNEQLAKLGNK